ncbi:hypothetical protein [Streptomyces lydicus]|uniref:hypothetical protein n=1 Tax=Streptomyces lydicus TaxID=47763 RepID=UPI001012CAD1|nr:hypothetical protein [Streptomyces lydicus]MCZ1008471.1 hypothetical protein [Streptomyces lydicus]
MRRSAEKGALAAVAALPRTPSGFADRVTALLAGTGALAAELDATLSAAERLVAEARGAVGG